MYECGLCGDRDYFTRAEFKKSWKCSCGGIYQKVPKKQQIEIEKKESEKTERNLRFSEEVWMHGRGYVGILPEKQTSKELPTWLKEVNDSIRLKHGLKPRWR